MTRISVGDLRDLFEKVGTFLCQYGNEIDFGECDMYWRIRETAACDMTQEPEIVVGSLADDVGELMSLLKSADRPVTPADLNRLAGILDATSRVISPLV